MKRLWRWFKSRLWWNARKKIVSLLEENDLLQQRILQLQEERKEIEHSVSERQGIIDDKARELARLIKLNRSDTEEALKILERQENQIYAIGEKLRVAEETVKDLVTANKVISSRWKTQVMIEGYKQAEATPTRGE